MCVGLCVCGVLWGVCACVCGLYRGICVCGVMGMCGVFVMDLCRCVWDVCVCVGVCVWGCMWGGLCGVYVCGYNMVFAIFLALSFCHGEEG